MSVHQDLVKEGGILVNAFQMADIRTRLGLYHVVQTADQEGQALLVDGQREPHYPWGTEANYKDIDPDDLLWVHFRKLKPSSDDKLPLIDMDKSPYKWMASVLKRRIGLDGEMARVLVSQDGKSRMAVASQTLPLAHRLDRVIDPRPGGKLAHISYYLVPRNG